MAPFGYTVWTGRLSQGKVMFTGRVPRVRREEEPGKTGAGVKVSGDMKGICQCLPACSPFLLLKLISVTLKLDRPPSAG